MEAGLFWKPGGWRKLQAADWEGEPVANAQSIVPIRWYGGIFRSGQRLF